jgi:hypothetical protein
MVVLRIGFEGWPIIGNFLFILIMNFLYYNHLSGSRPKISGTVYKSADNNLIGKYKSPTNESIVHEFHPEDFVSYER